MNNHMKHEFPLSYVSNLSFSAFPSFLEWVSSNWNQYSFIDEEAFFYWCEFYSTMLKNPYMAAIGSILTLEAACFLEYDLSHGIISKKEAKWWFDVWQSMIFQTLVRGDNFDTLRRKCKYKSPQTIKDGITFHV